MNIWSEWKDSLSLLYPANLKLFLLVTLNTLRQTLLVWFRHYWSFIVLYAVFIAAVSLPAFGFSVFPTKILEYGILFWSIMVAIVYRKVLLWIGYTLGVLFLTLLFLFLEFMSVVQLELISANEFELFFIITGLLTLLVSFIIAMRPSVDLKDYRYFNRYMFHSMISVALLYGILQLYSMLRYVPHYTFRNSIGLVVIAVISIFAIMFFLDGKASIKNLFFSIYRALKMFLYNLPFIGASLLLGYVLFLGFAIVWLYAASWLNPTGYINVYSVSLIAPLYLFFFCVALVMICFFGNFYVKKSQEQYKLYFDK